MCANDSSSSNNDDGAAAVASGCPSLPLIARDFRAHPHLVPSQLSLSQSLTLAASPVCLLATTRAIGAWAGRAFACSSLVAVCIVRRSSSSSNNNNNNSKTHSPSKPDKRDSAGQVSVESSSKQRSTNALIESLHSLDAPLLYSNNSAGLSCFNSGSRLIEIRQVYFTFALLATNKQRLEWAISAAALALPISPSLALTQAYWPQWRLACPRSSSLLLSLIHLIHHLPASH